MDSVIHPLNNWAWRVGLRTPLVKKKKQKQKTKNKKQILKYCWQFPILMSSSVHFKLLLLLLLLLLFFFFTACTPMLCCESLMHVSETTIKLVI